MSARELDGRVAFVLGGGSIAPGWGIGKATAVAFARAGAAVAVGDRNPEAAREVADMIQAEGGRAVALGMDVSDDTSLTDAFARARGELGRIDVVHHNVGLGRSGDPAETSGADWRAFTDANLTSLHTAFQAALGDWQTGGGVFLTTSSIAGLRHVGYPHLAYGVTKAAALQFVQLVAVDYAHLGIRANAIVAGFIDTPRIDLTLSRTYGGDGEAMRAQRSRQVPLGRMGTAFDVAEAAVFLASDRAGYISGTHLVVDGALSATIRQ